MAGRDSDGKAELGTENLRERLAPLIAAEADSSGWNLTAVRSAASRAGLDTRHAEEAFAEGAVSMLKAWFEHIDREMNRKLPAKVLATLKIRERIARLLEARLEALAPHRKALKAALSILGRPLAAREGGSLLWKAADSVWCMAGDTATDYNHYTKRGLVSAIYAATLHVFVDDSSQDYEKTRSFLAKRIDNVMQIETIKRFLLRSPNKR
jgi:ubiquinone biosynthesis protein COQ9